MFDRIANSWKLVKASYEVLRADKELIVFPIVSTIGLILVTLAFAIPLAAMGFFEALATTNARGETSLSSGAYIVIFLFYLVNYAVIIFANSALVGAALIRLNGGDPTVRDGFRIASEHIGAILGYAVISATVGMILNALRNDRNILGRIVGGLLGMAWNLLTFLVIPVLVTENVGPIEAIQRSGALLKKTWGEQIVGNFGIGAVFGLIMLAAIFLVGAPLIALASASGSAAAIFAAVVIVFVLMAAIGLFASTLSGIYQAALYRYATEGSAGNYFEEALIKGAFRRK